MPLGSFRLNTLGNNAAPVNNNQGWILTMTPASGTSYATSIDVDGANNVYFTGYNNTDHLIYAMKTNSSGTIQWQKSLDITGIERGYAIAVDASSRPYCVGTRNNDADGIVWRLTTDGGNSYQKLTSFGGTEYINSVAINSAGNPVVCGYTSNYGTGDGTICQLNSGGTSAINARSVAAGTAKNEYMDIALDSSNNPHCCGYHMNGSVYDINVTKFDASASYANTWHRRINDAVGGNNLYASGICVGSDGSVYIAGGHSWQASGYPLLIKMSSGAGLTFSKLYYQSSGTYFFAIDIDSSDNVYCLGTHSAGGCQIVKINSSGTVQWARRLTNFTVADQLTGRPSLRVKGSFVYIAGHSGTAACVAKLPTDGTATGTYGSFVYSSFTPSELSQSYSISNYTGANTSRTVTPSDAGGTVATTTLTSALTSAF